MLWVKNDTACEYQNIRMTRTSLYHPLQEEFSVVGTEEGGRKNKRNVKLEEDATPLCGSLFSA